MGLFDYMRCEYPCEGLERDKEYQTKDTPAQYMEHFTITKDGQLVHHTLEYYEVPEHERPYWGKPEWEGLGEFCGAIGSRPAGDIAIAHRGAIEFHDFNTETRR